jgi:ribonuclease HII
MLLLPLPGQVGCDEVGRGALCGDVVAAAVLLPHPLPDPENPLWNMIRDSKKVTKKRMPILAAFIQRHAIACGIGRATPTEIDRINILRATMAAMHRALDALNTPFESILVDGTYFSPYRNIPHSCRPAADASYLHVAAASILAKNTRDQELTALVHRYPELQKYELLSNVGYGTAAHMQALREHGPSFIHRTSFAPCRPPPSSHPRPPSEEP